jgi:hypothetical protein
MRRRVALLVFGLVLSAGCQRCATAGTVAAGKPACSYSVYGIH